MRKYEREVQKEPFLIVVLFLPYPLLASYVFFSVWDHKNTGGTDSMNEEKRKR